MPTSLTNISNRHSNLLPLVALAGVLISLPYFSHAAQWIFINADEAKYSLGASQFLGTGSWGYSGRKPGSALIVAVAQAILLNTPTASFYAAGVVGLLLVLVIYLIAKHYFPETLSLITSLVLSSSLLFQYYTKTHIIFSSFFFALGVLFYLQSLTATRQSIILFLSGMSMGAGLSCYYNLELYIPVLLLPEFMLSYKMGGLKLRTRGLPFLGGVILIPFFMDLYAVTCWMISGRFSEPVTMSLFDHLKLTHVGGFNYPWDRFTSLFMEAEGKMLSILFVLGMLILVRRIVRYRDVTDLVLLALMVPPLVLQMRAWMGHLSVLRTFFSSFPFIVLVAMLPVSAAWNFISARLPPLYSRYLFLALTSAGFLWCGSRASATFQSISTISTGYQQVEQFFDNLNYDMVAYWGNQFAWRYYFRDRDALELQTEGHTDTVREGGIILEKALEPFQWVIVNQAGTSDLQWIEGNLEESGFVLRHTFASNEFDFFLVRQERFSDDYASHGVSKDIRVYESQTGS